MRTTGSEKCEKKACRKATRADISCLCQLAQPTNGAIPKPGVDQQLTVVAESIAYLRTVAAAVVETVHAPPATVFWHALHFQMPTAWRFTES